MSGDADKKSSPRKGRNGDDDSDNAEERGWPRRQEDANDDVSGRCRGTVSGNADEKSSPMKGRSGDDDTDDVAVSGDADDDRYGGLNAAPTRSRR